MGTTNIPNSMAAYGKASAVSETFNPANALILGGPIQTMSATLLDPNADVGAFAVLGRITASGKLTVCDLDAEDGSEVPYAILMYALADPGADATVQVYRAGKFNMGALTWHASFNTEAKKLKAFDGTNPQTIYIGKPATGSPS